MPRHRRLKLVWGEQKRLYDNDFLDANLEVQNFKLEVDHPEYYKSFIWKSPFSTSDPSAHISTLIIEVDTQARAHQLWYLFPLVILLGLALVNIYLKKEPGHGLFPGRGSL